MAESSLNEFAVLVNQLIELQENISSYLTKAEAMIEVGLSVSFAEHADTVPHGYFWALSDMVKAARELNEQTLNLLLTQLKSKLNPKEAKQ